MINQLQFRISAGLKNIIGKELITDDFVAIFELVKNSFDAHSTKVIIEFKSLNHSIVEIKITDNGKGMNYQDLLEKWLFVAYSAKKDRTEDEDYRNKIQSRFFYAGAKGIGRFSCDKLGGKLKLITTKDEENSRTEQIYVDWSNFEQNSKDQFIDVSVEHSTLDLNPSDFLTGTILEISELREESNWDADKLLRLKRSLAKLINPFDVEKNRKFEIEIIADSFKEHDERHNSDYKKINGLVKNNLFDLLKEKTVKIYSSISEDGKTLTTELHNNGVWLYRIIEENLEYNLLHNILIELYYLNRTAKNNFTRLMGIRSGEYGSVFMYKNGIRIYPYGEPGEDPLFLDIRQQKRIGNYLGTSELIGRIEIFGENDEFKETTSRGDGLIKNSSYSQLYTYLIEKAVERLESYWRNVIKYGVDIEEYNAENIEAQLINQITNFSSNDSVLSIEFNPDFLEQLLTTQNENNSAKSLINSIERIARETDNPELNNKIKRIKATLEDAILIAELAEDEIKEKEKELKEKDSQNLFLKSLKSQEFTDLVNLMHHIGISSGVIGNYLKFLNYKLSNNLEIEVSELKEILGLIGLENQKILSISRFSTKANFKVNAENQKLDLISFISEYVNNVAKIYSGGINLSISYDDDDKFITIFKPIEMTILLDNLINNSKKAKAKILEISLDINFKGDLEVVFSDDGIGIPSSIKDKIFNFGFTTTGGSGLGLFHVKDILLKNSGSINILEKNDGAKLLLTFKKR